jgi:hypothetical protein
MQLFHAILSQDGSFLSPFLPSNPPPALLPLGVCIQTGSIVWVNGHFPAGSWSDLKIFKAKLANHL